MNTATDLIGMDNETIAHRLISMGKGKGVMQALLAHAGLGYTAASYIAADIPGAVSGTVLLIDYRPGDVRVHVQLHNPRDCEQFAPGYNVQLHPVGDRGAVAKGERREVEHCSECGGPDVYHAAFCSKAGE